MTRKLLLSIASIILIAQTTAISKDYIESSELLMGGIQADRLASPTACHVDKNGNIYVASKGTKEIQCLGKDLKLKFRIGGYGFSEDSLFDLQDMAVHKEQLLVSDTGMLKIFDLKGNFVKNITKIKDFTLSKPSGLFVDTRNRIYLCDPGINKVFVLESDFNVFRIYDSYKQPTSFFPVNENYYVFERETQKFTILSGALAKIKSFGPFSNARSFTTDGIQKLFLLDGSDLRTFTLGGVAGKSFNLAEKTASGLYCGIGLNSGKCFVSSTLSHELLQVDENGKVSVLLDHDSNRLCLPESFEIDENGRIFVNDTGNGKTRVLDQKGNELYSFSDGGSTKIAISNDLLAGATRQGISVSNRSGRKIFEIPEKEIRDIEFEADGSLLVLKKGTVDRYSGATLSGTVVSGQNWGDPVAISSGAGSFAVADADNLKIHIYSTVGAKLNSIQLSDRPRDLLLLSIQRIVVLGESSVKLIDHSGKVLRSFGRIGGPFSRHLPTTDKVSYDTGFDQLTDPVAISRFGKWIYVLDRTGMRLVKHPKEVLLEQAKIKITPTIIDFKYVQPDSEEELEVVIENIGGDSLEGYFTSIPKWITLSTKHAVGDEVIIKLKARTFHFIPRMVYRESLVLESNAGRFVIPCVLTTPDSIPAQINIEFQIGNKTVTVNGKNIDMDIAPYIKDGATMISLKFITDCLMGATEFSEGIASVNFGRKNLWVVAEVGIESATIVKGDQTTTKPIKPPPELKSGKPCLPLQFFTDLLDCEVYWDKQTKKVRVIYIP